MKRLFIFVATLAFSIATAPSATADPPPGEYTYSEAVAIGLVNSSDDFYRPPNTPDCPPLPAGPYPSEGEDDVIPDDAPECYMSPESQNIIVIVPAPGDLAFGDPLPVVVTHHFTGSWQERAFGYPQYQGGAARMEVSDPTICHHCGISQHLYSRIAGLTGGDFEMEVGWAEINHLTTQTSTCKDADEQQVLTVTQQPGAPQKPMCHRAFDLQAASFYSFRVRQCGDPGVYRICFGIWDQNANPPAWRLLRSWSNVARCQDPDGSSNCIFQYFHEMASSGTWFDLNGGPDGLKMRNIRARTAPFTWPLVGDIQSNHWTDEANSPYSMCGDARFYRFRTFHGFQGC